MNFYIFLVYRFEAPFAFRKSSLTRILSKRVGVAQYDERTTRDQQDTGSLLPLAHTYTNNRASKKKTSSESEIN